MQIGVFGSPILVVYLLHATVKPLQRIRAMERLTSSALKLGRWWCAIVLLLRNNNRNDWLWWGWSGGVVLRLRLVLHVLLLSGRWWRCIVLYLLLCMWSCRVESHGLLSLCIHSLHGVVLDGCLLRSFEHTALLERTLQPLTDLPLSIELGSRHQRLAAATRELQHAHILLLPPKNCQELIDGNTSIPVDVHCFKDVIQFVHLDFVAKSFAEKDAKFLLGECAVAILIDAFELLYQVLKIADVQCAEDVQALGTIHILSSDTLSC